MLLMAAAGARVTMVTSQAGSLVLAILAVCGVLGRGRAVAVRGDVDHLGPVAPRPHVAAVGLHALLQGAHLCLQAADLAQHVLLGPAAHHSTARSITHIPPWASPDDPNQFKG